VVVGGATWRELGAASHEADGVALGSIRVKGKQNPVEAWRLRALSS